MQERRSCPRAKVACRIAMLSGLRIVVYNASIENMGEGGMRVMIEERLPNTAPVTLEIFPVGRHTRIRCLGQVIWVNEFRKDKKSPLLYDTGIKFTHITATDKEEIKKLVQFFLSKQSPS